MAKRTDIKRVLILGSGPIVIGQACEFDYSGTQACKALMNEGLEVILVNSNPATIMTDPEVATKVYVEPLKVPFVEKIIEKEKPDVLIPTLGGQTALNLGLALNDMGILEKHGVEMIGADPDIIRRAEDRDLFKTILDEVDAKYPRNKLVRSFEEGIELLEKLNLPLIFRPNYTLGGGGGGVAYSVEEYEKGLAKALKESPTSEVLVEESLLGWKEFELEVMRDKAGTVVIVCSIENIDPCGVHTGDSITVAPQQTLTDREYQDMRDEAIKIVNKVGLQTGGANIQFATHPETGQRVVIEMNPRVSRSSALASKATGFPIAKIAALVAIGYTLDELQNDITKTTPSCYEPALDYVITKIPYFAFEKFHGAEDRLSTQMKAVGEVMGVGRTFKESLMKSVLSMEKSLEGAAETILVEGCLGHPNSQRLLHVFQAFREGQSVEQLFTSTQITPWFLEQIKDIIDLENHIKENPLDEALLLKAKRMGFSDDRLAKLSGQTTEAVFKARHDNGIRPTFYQIDTCAGEFASSTPYYYSTYWGEHENDAPKGEFVGILGSGPNRIGQGIEFDYSCVRGVKAYQKEGYQVAMINSNPETVSTDYDTSDALFFEPMHPEFVSEVLHFIQPKGFVAQLGGQTPINMAKHLSAQGFEILGSPMDAIDLAEDRGRFIKVCQEFDFKIPKAALAANLDDAQKAIGDIGFPVMCRPSYVLGGRRMEVVENGDELVNYFEKHGAFISEKNPCLIDEFLAGALEVDVDLIRGKDWTVIGGVVEHIEAAGVHSGDSMGVLPPQRLKPQTFYKVEKLSKQLADRMGVVGHLNLQLAVMNDDVYMIEANPRSSRSVPFTVKATGIPLVHLGVQAALGKSKSEVNPDSYKWLETDTVSVKGVVFPFKKFPEADSILGPEMKSTGESMGRGQHYAEAMMKAYLSSQVEFPETGEVFFSLREKDKRHMLELARELKDLGFTFSATGGTAKFFSENGLKCETVKKVHEGRPHCVDRIRSGKVALVFNTTSGRQSIEASFSIRRSCIDYSVPCITESDAATAFVLGLKKHRAADFQVNPL